MGKLTPVSPEVISRQATINIGAALGGSSMPTRCRHHWARGARQIHSGPIHLRRAGTSPSSHALLTPLQTVRFKNELRRNITIKLGYANAKIYRCPKCPRLGSFRHARHIRRCELMRRRSYSSNKEDDFSCDRPGCTGRMLLERCAARSTRVGTHALPAMCPLWTALATIF